MKFLALIMSAILTFSMVSCTPKDTTQYDDINISSTDEGVNAEYKIVTDKIDEIYSEGTPATTQEVLDAILSVMPIENTIAIDDQRMTFLEIDLDAIESYSGVMTSNYESTDEVVVIRANDDSVDDMVEAMKKRRDARADEFESYDQIQSEKASNGKILVYGNDVILVIVGNIENYDNYEGTGVQPNSEYADLNTTSTDEGLNAQYQIVTDKVAEIYSEGTPATAQEVLDGILSAMPVQMPNPMDDQFMQFLEIDLNNVAEYAGVISGANISSDELIVVRANEGSVDAVVSALEERRNNRISEFESYLPDQYEKAKHGKILVYGNDVIYAIMGDTLQYDMSGDASGETMLPEGGDPVADIPAAD